MVLAGGKEVAESRQQFHFCFESFPEDELLHFFDRVKRNLGNINRLLFVIGILASLAIATLLLILLHFFVCFFFGLPQPVFLPRNGYLEFIAHHVNELRAEISKVDDDVDVEVKQCAVGGRVN